MTKSKIALLAVGSMALLLVLAVLAAIVYVEVDFTNVSEEEINNPSILLESDHQYLIRRGLTDPVNDIVKNLMLHSELIPCKGTLGGNPGFDYPNEIKVNDRGSVTAMFSDGHYDGTIDLTFTVLEGNIVWKAVKWNCQGYD